MTARKPLYEHQADRTVVHVADSPLASGATALEVLGRAPGVSSDGKDNLSLRGRQGLLVVVDGKRVALTGTELAEYLKALPAEQVQTIELITNPPAQYDAQGGAGVIAINLKKDQRLGTNGSATLGVGRGGYGRYTGGLALNHRRQRLNLYGTYTYTERRYFTRFDFDRRYAATDLLPAASSTQANDQVSHLRSHAAKVGLDLTLSKRTMLGASLTGLLSHIDNNVDNQTQFLGLAGDPLSRYSSATAQDIDRPSGSASLNLRHALADSAAAAAFTLDADYARYHTTRLLAQHADYDRAAARHRLPRWRPAQRPGHRHAEARFQPAPAPPRPPRGGGQGHARAQRQHRRVLQHGQRHYHAQSVDIERFSLYRKRERGLREPARRGPAHHRAGGPAGRANQHLGRNRRGPPARAALHAAISRAPRCSARWASATAWAWPSPAASTGPTTAS